MVWHYLRFMEGEFWNEKLIRYCFPAWKMYFPGGGGEFILEIIFILELLLFLIHAWGRVSEYKFFFQLVRGRRYEVGSTRVLIREISPATGKSMDFCGNHL